MTYVLRPIGYVRSTLRELADAPRQGPEGAPEAWLELDPELVAGLSGLAPKDDIIVITWLDRADRGKLLVHPRGDPKSPLTGVFATRSPHRPNPLGLHRVEVQEISGHRVLVKPLEAIDGTPVIDIKPVI